jgi:nucleoside phosphorylase
MESYGMFHAAVNSNSLASLPICIKSVCDFADGGKGDKYQKYAAYTSAEFMKYLIQNELKF